MEIKSFVGSSELHDLEEALGQFLLYRAVLEEGDSGRVLYLAVAHEIGLLVRGKFQLKLLSFDAELGTIVQWID